MADPDPARQRAAAAEWRTLALLLTLMAAVLGWQNGLGRPDYALYDAAAGLGGRPPSNDIVIIAIDEASLAALGRWPWPRAVHATLLEKLRRMHPKAIGLDLILAEPDAAASGAADAALARALRASANVVLPVLMESTSAHNALRATLPLPALAASAAALGHIHVEIDADGIARSVFLREGPAASDSGGGAARWPHFALALQEVAGPKSASASAHQSLPGERAPNRPREGTWSRDHWLHIPFAGPPGTFPRVSYIDVLLERASAADLAGKYLLVGATAAGLGDAYPTPVSGHSRAMPGVEINANVLDALLHGRGIVRTAPWANALLSALIVLAVMTGLLRLTPRQGLALVAASIAAVLLCAWSALAVAAVWFAPSACLVALALAYPLWSWRRLEATLTYLGREFERLEAEPDILPRAVTHSARTGGDLLEQRIRAVEAAAQRLRDTRRFTADTLGSLPDATLVADSAGKILLANRTAARHFNLAAATDLHGRYIADLFSALPDRTGRGVPFSWDSLRELALNAERAAVEAAGPDADKLSVATTGSEIEKDGGSSRLIVPDGSASESVELNTLDGRRLLAHCARSVGSNNATIGWIVSLIDISALRGAESKRDEVLAFLSHDMRAPQSSILALLELHALDPAGNSKEDVHARIENYARKTLDLSEQFLQLSRAETKEYEFSVVDLSEIAEEAIDEVWVDSSGKDIGIEFHFDGEPAPVNADRSMLARATVNLLTNAIKYSPAQTRVTVTVAARDGWFVLEVADQGYGISIDDQRHLFERYRRFSTPGAPKAAGAGLGMVFVKTVVEKHGGTIAVASGAGRGTCITLSLPPYAG